MFDFSARLRENAHLLSLLTHYAELGAEDRTIWQDRLMVMDGIDAGELTRLHGELIAFDWVEQNPGHVVMSADGTIPACYRVTPHGARAVQRILGKEVAEEAPEPTEKAPPRFPPRKRKDKTAPTAAATTE